jgi:hypothetical protein
MRILNKHFKCQRKSCYYSFKKKNHKFSQEKRKKKKRIYKHIVELFQWERSISGEGEIFQRKGRAFPAKIESFSGERERESPGREGVKPQAT